MVESYRHLCEQHEPKKKDQNCQEYATLSTFTMKNYQGGTSGLDEVSVGQIQQPKQVEAVKLLLARIHPTSERLFQMAKKTTNNEDSTWYMGRRSGKTLFVIIMMKGLSNKAH